MTWYFGIDRRDRAVAELLDESFRVAPNPGKLHLEFLEFMMISRFTHVPGNEIEMDQDRLTANISESRGNLCFYLITGRTISENGCYHLR